MEQGLSNGMNFIRILLNFFWSAVIFLQFIPMNAFLYSPSKIGQTSLFFLIISFKAHYASEMLSFFLLKIFSFYWFLVNSIKQKILICLIYEVNLIATFALEICIIMVFCMQVNILYGSHNTTLFTFCYFYDTQTACSGL
jgi:hypothetical protein